MSNIESSDESDRLMLDVPRIQQQEMEFSDDDYNINTEEFKPPILKEQTKEINDKFSKLCKGNTLFAYDLMDLKEPCLLDTALRYGG